MKRPEINFWALGGAILIFLIILYTYLPASLEAEAQEEAYAEEEAPAPEKGPAEVIYCWGDSMTAGSGSNGDAFPDALERLTGLPCINMGIPGDTSQEILERCLAEGKQENAVLVITMGDNGGWLNIDDLIGQYYQMIAAAGTDRYIICSSTDDPDDFDQIWGYLTIPNGLSSTWYEARYEKTFGDHLFIGRKYLIRNGLAINGIRETEEDRLRAFKGNISLQLRNPEEDNTHLNEAGYRAVAHGIFEKGRELGYW